MNLSDKTKDIIKEFVNIGIGKSAQALNCMLATHVSLQVPTISIVIDYKKRLTSILPTNEIFSYVHMFYSGDIFGDAYLVFSAHDIEKLMSVLLDTTNQRETYPDMKKSALLEIGNIVINSLIGSISNILHLQVDYQLPEYIEGDGQSMIMNVKSPIELTQICANTLFKLKDMNLKGYIVLLMEFSSFEKFLVQVIDNV